MSNSNLPTHDDDRVKIILAEYHELRSELMYFISEQRKSMTLMSTLVAGQVIFLLNSKQINYEVISYIYLFMIPFLIFILMIRSLEATSKIILLADYIHKGIKEQLRLFFGSNDCFFEWEEHKGKTNRLSRRTLAILDYSRWWVFGVGILISFLLGLWFLFINDSLHYKIIIPSSILNLVWVSISILVNKSFNEVEGEASKNITKA